MKERNDNLYALDSGKKLKVIYEPIQQSPQSGQHQKVPSPPQTLIFLPNILRTPQIVHRYKEFLTQCSSKLPWISVDSTVSNKQVYSVTVLKGRS